MHEQLQDPVPYQPPDLFVVLAPTVFSIAFFAWLTIAAWAKQRRLEREAFYRGELYRTLVERGELSAAQLARLRADEDARQTARQRGGLTLAGLVLIAIGVAMLIAFRGHEEPVGRRIGWLPLAVGLAIHGYAWLLLGRMVPNTTSFDEREP